MEAEAHEARMRRAQLLPASTDTPMVPHKPEPRGLTNPQPFRLRSEVRAAAVRVSAECAATARDGDGDAASAETWKLLALWV